MSRLPPSSTRTDTLFPFPTLVRSADFLRPDVQWPEDPVEALELQLAAFGFDPARAEDGDAVTIAFTHCPRRELADAHPDLVCSMKRGMVEGFLGRSEEHTSELKSLMRISYAVFGLKKKN